MKKTVLIAGGSGVIGSGIQKLFESKGFQVFILSRNQQDDASRIFWNPASEQCNWDKEMSIDLLINLCGSGIADKRWTSSRKKELEDSRIAVSNFLFNWCKEHSIEIGRYVGASGITAFPFDAGLMYNESDKIQGGYLQNLVGQWEQAHFQFREITKVSIVRIAPVIKADSGLIVKMSGIIKKGIGSYLGKGNQQSPWIHHQDLEQIFYHIDQQNIDGIVHGAAGNCSNKELTDGIAKQLGRRIWLPKTPAFVMKLMFGEMAEIMLGSLEVSSDELIKSGFKFRMADLSNALEEIHRDIK